MDIGTLCDRLGVHSSSAQRKAGELLRLSRARCLSLGRAEMARPVVCLDLANRLICGVELPRAQAVKYAGVTEAIYDDTLAKLRRVLELTDQVTAATLGVVMGCVQVTDAAEELLTAFKCRYLDSTRDIDNVRLQRGLARPGILMKDPAYVAASFYLAARVMGERLDRSALIRACHADKKVFNAVMRMVCDSMQSVCSDMLQLDEEDRGDVDNESSSQQE